MSAKKSNGAIIAELLLVVFLWGGSNAGSKFLVGWWPAGFVGSTRLFCAGLALTAVLKWTNWLGTLSPLTAEMKRALWWRVGLSLACYIEVFNLALRFTSVSHVALDLGMSPIWALLWDHPPSVSWRSAQRYGAAALAFSGVLVLTWPSLRAGNANSSWLGEALGLLASVLWANYGLQCRWLGGKLPGAEIAAHAMWRAGLLLMPVALFEVAKSGLVWRTDLVVVQCYCIVAGGVVAYALWNNALRHWPTSQVYLFNNLVPLSTMGWAWVCLREPVTSSFGLAMVLVVAGVVLGQSLWEKILGARWQPTE